jgi:hypothetical protein
MYYIPMTLVPEYCFDVLVEEHDRKRMTRQTVLKECSKIRRISLDGLHPYITHVSECGVYPDPCLKMGVDRGGFTGCAFSPLEAISTKQVGKVRVGQQKQVKRR